MDTLRGSSLDPVTLSYWPTCKNALTWSLEDLAVATGEQVYILTPRDASRSQGDPGHKQWHTFALRVNQFDPSEWPFQDLATITQFSIGEELSESTVLSLSWSPSGLGIYRRSVLAILTSNLILSLWESNGRLGTWQRTAVVNQFLPIQSSDEDTSIPRRKRRVRAFHWLPALSLSTEPRWGLQLLAVADDDFTISFFQLWKTHGTVYGQWSFKLLGQYKVPDLQHFDANAMRKLSLRTILAQSSPISKLESSKWQIKDDPSNHPRTAAVDIKVSFGQCSEAKYVSLQAKLVDADSCQTQHELALSVRPSRSASGSVFLETPADSQFNLAVKKPRSDFDRKFGLGGRVRVNYWGTAFSPDHTIAAACISFHPLDMIEYGAPSSQRTTVVFIHTHEPLISDYIAENPSRVQERILEFVRDSPFGLVKTDLDRNILRTAAALIKLNFKDSPTLTHWTDELLTLLPTSASGEDTSGTDKQQDSTVQRQADSNADHTTVAESGDKKGLDYEICELCGDIIPFSADSSRARCNRGHQFCRCSLSFVAIQEPGISKYCSKCGRQFLDPGKLESADGPSLSQALFDNFDVCPYCQGKFRG
ncbi:uncharacterized protein Z519_05175 [Cladophialophora bantiana CBS 173.52]|uniref:Transcription factor IIIC putative zinc-finger domain-containing protein n=1 Tax=Cladophialophora bantiana (strain ATCC 10958 / CBS 173.52 / CDC B-1940 / NIH 8579) TaxID=1442370 RepID=A0A0D2HSK3_CLAB1|nr:uncharacterized protein Z519_05175 [Cladophialophora bantiana CBS 173.52]KIW93860.1 hypothetical protein Z519_05175 [Cladophialophora bantiana CBS 173.52]